VVGVSVLDRFPFFVENAAAGSRKDTAILLVGTAREFGISQRSIKSARTGFYITEELAALLYDESAEDEVSGNEPEPEPEPETTKTSGNRAAKKNSQKGK
jgi:hypothetical protein